MSEHRSVEQLRFLTDWTSVPSPKIRRKDRVGPYAWSRLYTGFSESFALGAMRLLAPGQASTVLDPFAGAGTSLIAAARLGHRVIGADLDPVSAVLSRAAFAVDLDKERTAFLLPPGRSFGSWRGSIESHSLYPVEDLVFAQTVFRRLEKATGAEGRELLDKLLGSKELDSEVVALASLLVAANDAAAVVRGSNPVWFRSAREGEPVIQNSLRVSAARWFERIAKDVLTLKIQADDTTIMLGDFRELPISENSIDIVLTSPPYLNRVDYPKYHLAALNLLSGMIHLDLEVLRVEMMGTTKMADKPDPESCWGPTCLETLKKIRSHPSKASDSYYFYFYSQYFRDTFELVKTMKRLCAPSAKGAIVLQDSYYKEIRIPLAEIWIEMSQHFGVRASTVRFEHVHQHLGTLSPSQKNWHDQKVLSESVLLLEF